jgi:Fe-S-cluster containining protein
MDVEIEAIRQTGREMPAFQPYKGSDKVFQVKLKPSKVDASLYACPFLDEDNYVCTIYEKRPFDCWAWPFLFSKGKNPNSTTLACFTEDWCLGLREAKKEDFTAYQQYMTSFLTTEEYSQLIRDYPELLWEHKERDTFQVSDITLLLNC